MVELMLQGVVTLAHVRFQNKAIKLALMIVCLIVSVAIFRLSGLDSVAYKLYQFFSGTLTDSQVHWLDSGYEDSNIELIIDVAMLIIITAILYIIANCVINKLRNLR